MEQPDEHAQVEVMVGGTVVSASVDGSSAFVASPSSKGSISTAGATPSAASGRRAAPQCGSGGIDSTSAAAITTAASTGVSNGTSSINTSGTSADNSSPSAAATSNHSHACISGSTSADTADDDPNVTFSRTAKVAKLKRSDHGTHGISTPGPPSVDATSPTGGVLPSGGSGAGMENNHGGGAGAPNPTNLLKKMSQGLTGMYEALQQNPNGTSAGSGKSGNSQTTAQQQQFQAQRQRVGSTDRVSSAGSASTTATAGKKRMSPCADLALGDPILEGMVQAQQAQVQGQAAKRQDPQVAFGAGRGPAGGAGAGAGGTTAADARPSPRRPGPGSSAGGVGVGDGGIPQASSAVGGGGSGADQPRGLLHAALGGSAVPATAAPPQKQKDPSISITKTADTTPTKASRSSSISSTS